MARKNLRQAEIEFDGQVLSVDTGCFSRQWHWTGRGFLTSAIEQKNGRTWSLPSDVRDADWQLPTCEDGNPEAILDSTLIDVGDDEGFTSEHLGFAAEMTYPEAKVALRFVVWAYPGAAGLRMQLWVRGLEGYVWEEFLSKREVSDEANQMERLRRGTQRQDLLPTGFAGTCRRMFGYHSDTQNRNDCFLDLLLEATDEKEVRFPIPVTWANAVCVEDGEWGLAMLKESHRCVNQRGHDCGIFLCLPGRGVESHGWGVLPQEIDSEWRPAWATWCLAYATDDRSRQSAFKAFDQVRYPVRKRDICIQANTWGSSQGWLEHREAAAEANVLREIDSCADLGIDVLQIDDGWQGNDYSQWSPVPERYPHGWQPVREHAKEKGVALGLWLAAMGCSLEDLTRNARDGGFISYKLDFAHLTSRKMIDGLMIKVREFVKGQNHEVRVNWDLTEVDPRYGFYFAREFGCIYLENRKPVLPRHAVYRPATVLKDLWEVSKYCNLLKFQGPVQNIDLVDPLYSDAAAYEHDYCVAITLMSSPLFFCETHFYSEAARAKIRPLLAAYTSVRDQIYCGMIHPIGAKPDGGQWTGFECVLPEEDQGFLLLFREPSNPSDEGRFHLPHRAGRKLALENLLTGECWTQSVDEKGRLCFCMETPGSYRFLRYKSDLNHLTP